MFTPMAQTRSEWEASHTYVQMRQHYDFLSVMGMQTISWTALSFQPALLAVHFMADDIQR